MNVESENTSMWEWLVHTTYNLMAKMDIRSELDVEDIQSNVFMELLNNKELARRIYETKNERLLFKIIRTQIYKKQSKNFYNNATDYAKARKILEICNKYKVKAIPENAYKISAIINKHGYDIRTVESLLIQVKPKKYSYDEKYDSENDLMEDEQ